jgi:hypothetical protein
MNLALLETISLEHGAHQSFEEGACAMEAVAYIAGEKFSDHPQCACPVIASFMRSWNDSLRTDEDRNRLLKPLISKVIGTRGSKALEKRRSMAALDWYIRVWLPAWLKLCPATAPLGLEIAALPVITKENAAAAGKKVQAASSSADAAWAAAGAAAWDAARAAAGAAAWDAARAAAGAAAWDAAWAAAGAAAWDAAWAIFAPTVEELQLSATQLVLALCDMAD